MVASGKRGNAWRRVRQCKRLSEFKKNRSYYATKTSSSLIYLLSYRIFTQRSFSTRCTMSRKGGLFEAFDNQHCAISAHSVVDNPCLSATTPG